MPDNGNREFADILSNSAGGGVELDNSVAEIGLRYRSQVRSLRVLIDCVVNLNTAIFSVKISTL